MEPCTLNDIGAACGGVLWGAASAGPITRVCTDSRQAQPGDLFVALKGDRFDGHDYLAQAAERGVAAIVAEQSKLTALPGGCAVVAVADTRQALGNLAAWHRQRFAATVIAVGGSNGKTTTKELLGAVLGQKLNTVVSEASYNNDVGVPLTLLRLERGHDVAVVEVGTNHPGELAPLLRMAAPRFGVLTSLGREHLAYFGDLGGVVEEEGALAESLPPDGRLFVPGETPGLPDFLRRTRAAVVRVGYGPGNEWRADVVKVHQRGTTFHVRTPRAGWSGEYEVGLLGRHQTTNALLALAVGAELGLTPQQAARGLQTCPAPKMRLQLTDCRGIKVLDDSYNANAESMRAALETLQDLADGGDRVAVLGDMAELGPASQATHQEVGRLAATLGVNRLFAVGRMSAVLAGAAREAGLTRAYEFLDVETAAAAIKESLQPGDMVLVKASRATRLERIVERLKS